MNRRNREWTVILAAMAGLALPATLPSAPADAAPAPANLAPANPGRNPDAPIEADADHLDYDHATGRIMAEGNVVIRQGNAELRADRVLVHTETGDAYALGHVVLKRDGEELRGDKLRYNFKTGKSDTENIAVDATPFHILAGEATRTGKDAYELRDARVTTCENRYPFCHYHVSAKRIVVYPGDYLKTYGGVWWFGRVPVMYMPFWYRNLGEDSGFHFRPGMDSRMGPYMLSSYTHRVSPYLRLEHHLDYRAKRGVAVGEDLRWNVDGGAGDLMLYFADDEDPIDGDEDAATGDIDSERYRGRVRHQHTHGIRTYSLFETTYLSDTDIEEDFFERDYRRRTQPENYYVLTHRQDAYTVNLLTSYRVNDFFGNVNRLPELSLDVMRQQLWDSSFYYGGQTTAGFLQRVFPEDSGADDYDTFRIDTEHVVYQPRRFFGWLNVVPRAGYRGTYYTKTLETDVLTDVVTTFQTNTVVQGGVTNTEVVSTTATNETTVFEDGVNAFRSIPSIGVELSFKAYRILDPAGPGLRHVVEPYLDYTYAMDPTVPPEDLYQFDAVDTLDKAHQTRVGVRNKFQTRRGGRVSDILDLDVSTILNFATEGDEEFIEKLYADAEFDPTLWLSVRADGVFDVDETVIDRFNSRLLVRSEKRWEAGLEHRYIREFASVMSGDLTYYANRHWAANAFGRYDFEAGRVEEEGGYLQRNLDCLSVRLGGSILPGFTRDDGSERDDEYRVMIEFWLTAFPDYSVRSGSRY